jgi:hypothetical protein
MQFELKKAPIEVRAFKLFFESIFYLTISFRVAVAFSSSIFMM